MAGLGVDVGGVIIDRVHDGADTSFMGDNFLRTTAVPGVFEALSALVREQFGDAVFVVSKCGPRVQAKTLAWLDHHRFHVRTGVRDDHVRFCRRRADKAVIARALGLSHFVDDRLDVLEPMVGAVQHLYLFGPSEGDRRRSAARAQGIQVVDDWPELVDQVLAGR